MIPNLSEKLKMYVEEFNASDEELYSQCIDNDHAVAFLNHQIPLLDLPDKELEKVYYFRWWTFRKHWKETPHGHILSEFLPTVPWAGPFNSIDCAVGHHFREGRWMKDSDGWMKEYLLFFLEGPGDALDYSMWLISAASDYLDIHPDADFEAMILPKCIHLFEQIEEKHQNASGLFWSSDDRDGMEYTISGSGIRPTLNSYLYGDAKAIAKMAKHLHQEETSRIFLEKARQLKEKIDLLLWDEDFYKTIPCKQEDPVSSSKRPAVDPEQRVLEEAGYIPWYFDLPDASKDKAFLKLQDEKIFASPYGITTADQSHPKYHFSYEHECLWNGYIWPFATSQTMTGLANMLQKREEAPVSKELYYRLLKQYASSHQIEKQNQHLLWIDEVIDPLTGRWSSRDVLEKMGWQEKLGGYERGKDYNHSTFCDLILSGLLGICFDRGEITLHPLIPENWDHFAVTNLTHDNLTIYYDKDGSFYGLEPGLHILCDSSDCKTNSISSSSSMPVSVNPIFL